LFELRKDGRGGEGDFWGGSVHNFVGLTVEQSSPVYTQIHNCPIVSPHQPPKNKNTKEDISYAHLLFSLALSIEYLLCSSRIPHKSQKQFLGLMINSYKGIWETKGLQL
jgi:hypothetical protein